MHSAEQDIRSSHPVWWPDIVGMVLDGATDWDQVAELVTESYCVLAPKKLIDMVDRPGD